MTRGAKNGFGKVLFVRSFSARGEKCARASWLPWFLQISHTPAFLCARLWKIRWQVHSLECPFWWWQCSLVTNLYQWENWFGPKRLTYGSNNTLISKRMCSFTKQLVPLKTHQWFVLHTCASGAVIMNYLQHDLELLRKRWTCCRSFTQSMDLN